MAPKYRTEISDEDLHKLYLDAGRDASKLAPQFGCVPSTMRTRVRKMLARVEAHPIAEPRDPELINRVAELLQRSNVDPNTIQRIRGLKLKSYGVAIKNAEGRIETEGLYSTSFQADPIVNADDNPCLTQAPPITVLYSPHDAPRILRPVRTAVILSDAQIGYFHGPNGIEPMHDIDAINVAFQITAAVQPNELIFIGDWADNTQISRWPQLPEYDGLLQKSIDEASRLLGVAVSAAGHGCERRIMIGSNHGSRWELYALANAKALMGIRRAGDVSGWPVLSEPYLLRFDDMKIEFQGHYPGGEYWLQDNLVCTHAPTKKLEMLGSVCHGHLHRLTTTTWAQHGRHNRWNYFMYDCGSLCRVDATKDSKRLGKTAVASGSARTEWANGIMVIEMIDEKMPRHQVTQIQIQDGQAMFQGREFRSSGAT